MAVKSVFAFVLLLLLPLVAFSQDVDCLKCHAKLKKGAVVHPAVEMGCTTCHTGIDATRVPHKKTNKLPKGLSAEQPDLCYSCHDKAMFGKLYVHAAVGMGCTGCHNPHSSKNPKLLIAEAPELCMSCHDKAEFTKTTIHAPVAGGMCLSCHSPHASDEISLLLKKPVEVCLECHPEVPKKPHAVMGFATSRWHPVGVPKPHTAQKNNKKEKDNDQQNAAAKPTPDAEIKDPARPDRPFYCGSCHNPHSTSGPSLFRFDAKSSMGLCTKCHKK